MSATVLLIGHNDGIGQLAEAWPAAARRTPWPPCGRNTRPARWPTCSVPDGPWRDLAPGSAELLAFVRPRDLAVT